MPAIRPIPAVTFATPADRDVSRRIAPPYDVLDEAGKAALLARDPHNVVAIDLPHLPAKTAGPDAAYEKAGDTFRGWQREGVLVRRGKPAVFVYQQTYTHGGETFHRRGLIAGVRLQPFGRSREGGGIHPHEQTFSGPKEDRLKLMRATRAQLSPIFGLYSDRPGRVHKMLTAEIDGGPASFFGRSSNDGVLHEVWAVEEPRRIAPLAELFAGTCDIFIADGHHRYTTALNYQKELIERDGPLPADHPANFCLFVLIAMQDPGMIVLPTHRVLGGMSGFTWDKFVRAAEGKLRLKHFPGSGSVGDLAGLEKSLTHAQQITGTNPHAMGLYNPADPRRPLWIATTTEPDPLWETHKDRGEPWRDLDVAIVQHLIVEQLCQPLCNPGEQVQWKFPHTLEEFRRDCHASGSQLGILLRPTPLESVRKVSEAGELMPQKSTFFYPKLATGLVINPLD